MQREISDDVKIGASVIPFQTNGKAPAIDKIKMLLTLTMLS